MIWKPSGVFSTVALGKRATWRKRRATRVLRAASRAAEGAGFHGGQSIAVEDEAHADIKNHRGERETGADSSPRAFRFGTDFLRHQSAERGKKNSSKENSQKPEIQVGDTVEREAAR